MSPNPQFEKLSNFCYERNLPFWRTLHEAQRGYLWDKISGGKEIIGFRCRNVGVNGKDKILKQIFTHWRWDRVNMTLEEANEKAIEYFFEVVEKAK